MSQSLSNSIAILKYIQSPAPSVSQSLLFAITYFSNITGNRKQFCYVLKYKYNVSIGPSLKIYPIYIKITEYFVNVNPTRSEFCQQMKINYNFSSGSSIKIYQELLMAYQQTEGQMNDNETH